ncbi:MAG TPA: 16S rRNA (guanine(527)-N(7))-methyltransferase RsmG [Desulfotignum sp.]|nr:16S rRNA (guanine(527)-N(7))-methyltransferase RsmG [Desulfotignum sp.]
MKPQEVEVFCKALCQGSRKMGIFLTRTQLEQMVCHAAQLEKWNRKINLTAISGPAAMARKHFLDALAVQAFVKDAATVLDMGSGGGFPGLPLKVLNAGMQVVLVDASRKKVHFLKHVIRLLGTGGIDVIHGRIQDLHHNPDYAGKFDAVLARGVANLSSLAGLAAPLLHPEGTIYALKSPTAAAEEITGELEKQFAVQCNNYTLPLEEAYRCLIRLTPIKKVPAS